MFSKRQWGASILVSVIFFLIGFYNPEIWTFLKSSHKRTIVPLEEYRSALDKFNNLDIAIDEPIATQPGAWTIWFIDDEGTSRALYIGELDGNEYTLTKEDGKISRFVFTNLQDMQIFGETYNPYKFPTLEDLERRKGSGE